MLGGGKGRKKGYETPVVDSSSSMPRNPHETTSGRKGCGNACGKLYVHLCGIRTIHAKRGGKGDG